jgi:hypothetical protein
MPAPPGKQRPGGSARRISPTRDPRLQSLRATLDMAVPVASLYSYRSTPERVAHPLIDERRERLRTMEVQARLPKRLQWSLIKEPRRDAFGMTHEYRFAAPPPTEKDLAAARKQVTAVERLAALLGSRETSPADGARRGGTAQDARRSKAPWSDRVGSPGASQWFNSGTLPPPLPSPGGGRGGTAPPGRRRTADVSRALAHGALSPRGGPPAQGGFSPPGRRPQVVDLTPAVAAPSWAPSTSFGSTRPRRVFDVVVGAGGTAAGGPQKIGELGRQPSGEHTQRMLSAAQLQGASTELRKADAEVRTERKSMWKRSVTGTVSGMRGWHQEGNFIVITDPELATRLSAPAVLGDKMPAVEAHVLHAMGVHRLPLLLLWRNLAAIANVAEENEGMRLLMNVLRRRQPLTQKAKPWVEETRARANAVAASHGLRQAKPFGDDRPLADWLEKEQAPEEEASLAEESSGSVGKPVNLTKRDAVDHTAVVQFTAGARYAVGVMEVVSERGQVRRFHHDLERIRAALLSARNRAALHLVDRWLGQTEATKDGVPLFAYARPRRRAELLSLRALVLATAPEGRAVRAQPTHPLYDTAVFCRESLQGVTASATGRGRAARPGAGGCQAGRRAVALGLGPAAPAAGGGGGGEGRAGAARRRARRERARGRAQKGRRFARCGDGRGAHLGAQRRL